MTIARYWLSQVPIHRSIGEPYEAHRSFWKAFERPLEAPIQHQPFRFRLDRVVHRSFYLVQSAQEPDWGRAPVSGVRVREVTLSMRTHGDFRFRLRANVQKTSSLGGKRRFIDIREPSALREWITRQAATRGFSLLEVECDEPRTIEHRCRDRTGGETSGWHVVKLNEVQFDGVLRVVDPSAFARALVTGVGGKAAFGLGLLTVL